MSEYYNPKRIRNFYTPGSEKPFRLSRSKIDLFINCPRCFYIDRRLGTGTPPGYPFNLNSAVDTLLKKEFDIYRERKEPHPLMIENQIEAIPFTHPDLDEWRENFKGVQFHHTETNLILTGAVDDVWINPNEELIVVDYKATSKTGEVTLDADWQIAYKRQAEFYQWLLRQNGFEVNDTAYFVYCNGDTGKDRFDSKLEFDIKVLPYIGDDGWVERTVNNAYECLNSDSIPQCGNGCDFCQYFDARKNLE